MNETKFIELLNLYIDHQISPAETALLEAEVKNNPERRRIYREYCQMQQACTVLAENFRTQAPASDPKLVDFKPRRHATGLVYAATFAAAAACVVVIFALRSKQPERIVSAPMVHDQMAVAAVKTPTAPVTATTPRPALQPVFGPRVLTLREQNTVLAEAAADQAAFTDWMNNIQLSTMPAESADDLRFDARATLQPDARTYRAGRPIQGKVEWTAFTFQK